MGDSPYQLSILNHRAAAHPLQNTVCFVQQLFICNLQDKIFVIFVVFVNLPNFGRITICLTVHCADNLYRTFCHFLQIGHRYGFLRIISQIIPIHRAKNTAAAVIVYRSNAILFLIVDSADNFSRCSLGTLDNRQNIRLIDHAMTDIHENSGIHIRNAMSQCCKILIRINICDRTNSLRVIPKPYANLIPIFRCFHRFHGQHDLFSIPKYLKTEHFPFTGLDQTHRLTGISKGRAVYT